MKLKNKLLLGGLTAVLLAVMSFSAWKIWVIRSEYHAGEAAYEDISHMISLPQKAAEPQPPVINKPAGAETLPDEDDTIWPEVDFAILREINPDIVAWIYIEGTKINYPIVQGEDNSYYLKHLFSGEWNGSGCIFLDFQNDASFADRHSITGPLRWWGCKPLQGSFNPADIICPVYPAFTEKTGNGPLPVRAAVF